VRLTAALVILLGCHPTPPQQGPSVAAAISPAIANDARGPALLDSSIADTAAPSDAPAVATIDAPDQSGWTQLQYAAQKGDISELERLLRAGANLEIPGPIRYADGITRTALIISLDYSQAEAARFLLAHGASIAGKLGTTALELAARDDDGDILELLLKRGVSVKHTLALHYAASAGKAASIRRLLHAGAAVDEVNHADHDYTPLIEACQENQLEAARALVEAGARVDQFDADGTNALHWAVFGARPIEIHIYRHMSGPHDTVWRPQVSAPIVELLVRHGAPLNAPDRDGNTPLHEAAMLDVRAAAEVLLRGGADRSLRNHDNKTPLELAHERENSVEELLKRPRR
jgi:ankyrin repeat protein